MPAWLTNLFSRQAPVDGSRALLADAIAELGDPLLVPQALAWFDDRETFENHLLDSGDETAWMGEERAPETPELAFEIFFRVLSSNHYIGVLDWADGAEEITVCVDALLARANLRLLDDEEKRRLRDLAAGGKRGAAFNAMRGALEAAALGRGRVMKVLDLGHDAYYPTLLTPAAKERWAHATFSRDFPVLP